MSYEVLDAIHLMYEDEPDVEADCYLYLSCLLSDKAKAKDLMERAQIALGEMGRCPYCGDKLECVTYKEVHTELDDCPVELIREEYCPHCDICGIEK